MPTARQIFHRSNHTNWKTVNSVLNSMHQDLVSIYDRRLQKDFRFENDDFSVMIDSQLITEKDLSQASSE